ncbi:uncharacterized protein LOC9636151 [Selaginella moellendorffii]|uniref:uncharacterized protein LOC9636151 n=1 Tax=Selaginella moellendorffii TaxID=88036 RepID=UPI000D1C4F90|nr:uncharacterized protein LOC9636151 [Selaginella moellendorffii]|eukprot:XP_024540523.1 uncharacterized protein LOC9636151 [Selaginella moellendorffii]
MDGDLTARAMDQGVQSRLQVRNAQRFPVHVMDIEVLIEEPGREERERKAASAKLDHSCIVQPRSSKLVKIPLASLIRPSATPVPYMLRANVAMKDRVHGAYQVSTERVRQMFFKDAADKKVKAVERKHLDGGIEGIHVWTNFPKEVVVAFDFQVKNSNFLPLKLLHADFSVMSDGTKILETKVVHNTSIPGKSSARIKMKLSIPLKIIRDSFPGGLPSSVLPVQMDISFWFKETFYGLYKIDARKTGVLVVPEAPAIAIHKVVFTFDEDNKPVARLELLVSNANVFDLELKSLEYQAVSKETGSTLMLAKFKDDDAVIVPEGGKVTIWALAKPGTHEFGSVLWKLYKGEQDYVVKTSLETETELYGKIVFQS